MRSPDDERVLIVDDNVALAENIAEILAGEGYTTEVAASAEEALAKALTQRISVLITDFRLPGINGAELVRRLRLQRENLHAVVISAHNDEETVDDARDAGAEFMAKPLDFGALHRFVRLRDDAG
jgi:DNA-binding response OmpR family regulator